MSFAYGGRRFLGLHLGENRLEVIAIADRVEIFVNFKEVRRDHSSAGGLLERRDGPVGIIPAQSQFARGKGPLVQPDKFTRQGQLAGVFVDIGFVLFGMLDDQGFGPFQCLQSFRLTSPGSVDLAEGQEVGDQSLL